MRPSVGVYYRLHSGWRCGGGRVAVARSRRVYHVFVLIAGAGRRSIRVPFVVLGVGAIVAALVTLQVVAVRGGFQGPLHGLISDYVATPNRRRCRGRG